MIRHICNYVIDVALLAAGLLCIATGFVKWPGVVYALGLSYRPSLIDIITQVHDWTGLLLGIGVVLHVALHIRWLMGMTRRVLFNRRGTHEKARANN